MLFAAENHAIFISQSARMHCVSRYCRYIYIFEKFDFIVEIVRECRSSEALNRQPHITDTSIFIVYSLRQPRIKHFKSYIRMFLNCIHHCLDIAIWRCVCINDDGDGSTETIKSFFLLPENFAYFLPSE